MFLFLLLKTLFIYISAPFSLQVAITFLFPHTILVMIIIFNFFFFFFFGCPMADGVPTPGIRFKLQLWPMLQQWQCRIFNPLLGRWLNLHPRSLQRSLLTRCSTAGAPVIIIYRGDNCSCGHPSPCKQKQKQKKKPHIHLKQTWMKKVQCKVIV